MKKTLILASLFAPAFAFSQELISFQPEPDFEQTVGRVVAMVKPGDAFAAAPECSVVDARFVAPVPMEQAEKMLAGCLSALSAKYGGVELSARRGTLTRDDGFTAQVQVLMIMVPKSLGAASPLMRDLNHALKARDSRLFGHKAVIERADDRTVTTMNGGAQNTVDDCILPTIVRRVETGADFIKYYGGCFKAPGLRVVDMRQSPAHKLGVIILSEAETPVVASLTGSVKIVAANGPVEVQLVAYSNTNYLP